MLFRRAHTMDVDFLFHDKASFDDQDLLDHRNDGRVAVLAYRGNRIDRLADGNPLDLDTLPRQLRVDELLVLAGHGLDAYPTSYDLSLRDRELFFMKWDHGVAHVVRHANLVGVGGHAHFLLA